MNWSVGLHPSLPWLHWRHKVRVQRNVGGTKSRPNVIFIFVRRAIFTTSHFEAFNFWHSIETNFSVWNQDCQLFVVPLCFPKDEQIQLRF